MPKIKLREHGVYALPDKREFIVRRSRSDEYSLYPPQGLKRLEFAEYRLNTEGRIISRGMPTRWRAEDLTDTGQTVKRL
ncbi:MAG: hypothetical protein H7Y30_08210 [Pyrinomonadaceae bacterium]|nr:hypothetical protein [Pyrinomonadaceae bacterium]